MPPPGFRAQLTRAPAALQSHIRQIEQINGQPVYINAVCRPGGTFYSHTTKRRHKSEHDGCKAVDFTPRPDRRSAVLSYARKNIPGYTLTYGWSPHIHIDLARQSKGKTWPQTIGQPRETARVVPMPRPRPVLAADFAVLDITPHFDVALLEREAMPVAFSLDFVEAEPEPIPPSRNIFEAFADSLLKPVGNCKGWDKIAPGVKLIVSDATRHFSRKYNQTLIAEANSCYRDAVHNRRVGGARNSAHRRFAALDFRIVAPDHSFTVSSLELWQFCRAHPLAKGCGIYKHKGIIHADVDRVLGRRAWDWRYRRPTRFAKAKLKKNKKFAKVKTKLKKKKARYASR